MKSVCALVTVVVALGLATSAQGAMVLAGSSSQFFSDNNAVDGNISSMWLVDNRLGADPNPWIAIDVTGDAGDNGTLWINSVTVNGGDSFGFTKQVELLYSADPVFATATFTSLGLKPITTGNVATVINMGVQAQYVKFMVTEVDGGYTAPFTAGNPSFLGLAELSADAVPEPATMGLLGLGLLGLVSRRKR